MKVAFCDVRGLLNDLNDKLAGDNGDRWREKLANMLREATFPTWRKLQIGLLRSTESYRELVLEGGVRIGNYARKIINEMTLVKVPTTLELVVVSVGELGFAEGAKFFHIVQRAHKLGLELCPKEVGPALASIYKDQPKEERLKIAIEPVIDSVNRLNVFIIESGGFGMCLDAYWFDTHFVFSDFDLWVFVRKS